VEEINKANHNNQKILLRHKCIGQSIKKGVYLISNKTNNYQQRLMKTLKDPQITVEYLNATLEEEIEDPDPTLDTQNIYKRKYFFNDFSDTAVYICE